MTMEEYASEKYGLDKETIYRKVCENLQAKDIDASFYENYSGRSMFGEQVPGISTKSPVLVHEELTRMVIEIANYYDYTEYEKDDALEEMRLNRQDHLGLGFILY